MCHAGRALDDFCSGPLSLTWVRGNICVTLTWTGDDGDEAVLEFMISIVSVGAGSRGARA